MEIQIPQVIKDRMQELIDLVNEYPFDIPVAAAAKFMRGNPAGLRETIFAGHCPFGVAWQKTLNGNRAFKIPTLKFFLWHANNLGLKVI